MLRGQPVTLTDVARQAQVSLATASRVLNGRSTSVGEQLRVRVLDAAAALDYIPNAHAQALAGGMTSTVGVITHDVSDPYFAAIARGAMREAIRRDVLVVLASTFRDPRQEVAYVSALRAQRARAILLTGSGFGDAAYTRAMRAELRGYQAAGGRVAMVSEHDLAYDAVLPDNRGGAAAMGRALVGLGHRRIGVVSGRQDLITVAHRLEGFQEALAAEGVPLPAGRVAVGDFSQEGGYDATRELVERGLPVTAVFCISDVMAIGALQALREAGIRVPEDVSLAGFDDIPIVSHLTPSLSTVALPLERMGEAAMVLALDEYAGTRRRRRPMPASVVLRGSTAGVPRPRRPR